MSEALWRRFKLIGNDQQKEALSALVKKKNLTREDLMLILKSIKIREDDKSNA